MVAPATRRVVFGVAAVVFTSITGAWPAMAGTVSFKVGLFGGAEIPPVTKAGTGTADLTWNPATRVVTWDIDTFELSSPITAVQLDQGDMDSNGPVTAWIAKQGNYLNGPFNGSATLTPDQAKQFETGNYYINVQTKDHPAGELRGQVFLPPPKAASSNS